jgi:hypothetical protein
MPMSRRPGSVVAEAAKEMLAPWSDAGHRAPPFSCERYLAFGGLSVISRSRMAALRAARTVSGRAPGAGEH